MRPFDRRANERMIRRVNLQCKQCGREIPAQDINIERLVAKCTPCNAVFAFDSELAIAHPAAAPKRAPVPMPGAFQLELRGGTVKITRSWRSVELIFMAVFCFVWDAFLLNWYGLAFGAPNPPLIMKLFPIGHVAVGIALTYRTIAGFLNKTTIEVSRGQLKVSHGPVPWLGGQTLATNKIQQLYASEHEASWSNNRSRSKTRRFQLNAIVSGGKTVVLLKGLPDAAQALFLEQELESYLGIRDRPVGGELPRG